MREAISRDMRIALKKIKLRLGKYHGCFKKLSAKLTISVRLVFVWKIYVQNGWDGFY